MVTRGKLYFPLSYSLIFSRLLLSLVSGDRRYALALLNHYQLPLALSWTPPMSQSLFALRKIRLHAEEEIWEAGGRK